MRVQQSVLLAALAFHTASAFVPPRSALPAVATGSPRIARAGEAPTATALSAGPPVISNWRYEPSKGTISGTVTNHPTIPDGDRITTSPVKNPEGVNQNIVVQTKSGSKYKLNGAAFGALIPAVEAKKEAEKKARAAADEKKAAAAAAAAAAAKQKAAATAKPAPAKPAPQKAAAPAAAAAPSGMSPAALRNLAKSKFALTGATVGGPDGSKYLLGGKPRQSSGRAAKIWTAYEADPAAPDVPLGFDGADSSRVKALTIKLSPDVDRMRLESTNYDKVQSGLFMGRFVKKMDYAQYVSSNKREFDMKVSALVIESGQYDLKALLAARKGAPLQGRALRDAAAAAGQCIQAVHSSNLVWTDLKTENFIVVSEDKFNREVTDSSGSMGLPGVKGIDLESVIARGGNPIDYSPEACPPEFARALMSGEGEEFVLDYSYDIWSLGMMLYELSTGRPYFDKKLPSVVTKLLCAEDFEADVSEVPDARLRDLIGKCLSLDPRRRPDITGFLLHPYFITTGIGPISF